MQDSKEHQYRPIWRWVIPICMGIILFANHYPRDVVAALEKQIESSSLLTSSQYTIINAFYFFPNIITPLLAGHCIAYIGGINISFLLCLCISTIGHMLFAYGGQLRWYHMMLVGRCLAGSMYEIIDALMPIVYLSKQFKSEWSVTMGILTVLMRSGSIFNFILTPIILSQVSLQAALWVATGVSGVGVLMMLSSWWMEIRWDKAANDKAAYHTLSIQDDDDRHKNNDDHMKSIEMISNTKTETNIVICEPLSSSSSSISSTSLSTTSSTTSSIALPYKFWLYMLVGVFIYGMIIPFWFLGSKYIQLSYHVSVSVSDAIIVIPEVVITIFAMPVGIITQDWTLSSKMNAISLSCILTALIYILLVISATISSSSPPPSLSLSSSLLLVSLWQPISLAVSLGLTFTVCTNVYWGSFAQAIDNSNDEAVVTRGSALLSCAVNILPSILPPLLAMVFGAEALGEFVICLAAISITAAVVAGIVAMVSLPAKSSISTTHEQLEQIDVDIDEKINEVVSDV